MWHKATFGDTVRAQVSLPLLARSVGSLQRSDTSGIGGEADMPRTKPYRRSWPKA